VKSIFSTPRNSSVFIIIVFIALFFQARAATRTAVLSGNWGTGTTWSGGSTPGCNDSLIIPLGVTVTISSNFDYTSCSSMKIVIRGTLLFVNGKKLQLPCNARIYIYPLGSIQSSGGGGSNNLIEICGTVWWNADLGFLTGPVCLPPVPCVLDILPIELSEFTAAHINSQVELKWSTQSEKNSDKFEIERSSDGKSFEKINTVYSRSINGTSGSEIKYSAMDTDPLERDSYYRLKMIDLDRSFKYSSVLTVNVQPADQLEFSIYPNPNNGEFATCVSGLSTCQQVNILLSDYTGNVVYQSSFQAKKSVRNRLAISALNLPSGIYTCSVYTGDSVYKTKVVVN
jgi:hypothetical protein